MSTRYNCSSTRANKYQMPYHTRTSGLLMLYPYIAQFSHKNNKAVVVVQIADAQDTVITTL